MAAACICSGIGVYIKGARPPFEHLPCAKHPLPLKRGQTFEEGAEIRMAQCVRALSVVRELLWPRETPRDKWPVHTLEHVAQTLEFLRPPGKDPS